MNGERTSLRQYGEGVQLHPPDSEIAIRCVEEFEIWLVNAALRPAGFLHRGGSEDFAEVVHPMASVFG